MPFLYIRLFFGFAGVKEQIRYDSADIQRKK
nr:MAG TPA: hypothetical protein [Caudoviricetes sp.]